jgi:glycosyltransferase involved in cell wall biosynthesis
MKSSKGSAKPCVAIVQPLVPHYREDFFAGLNSAIPIDLYGYESEFQLVKRGLAPACTVNVKPLRALQIGSFVAYDILPLFSRQYSVLVLMGSVRQPSTWLLLVLKRIIRKKVILWGHGISINRYVSHQKGMPLIYKLLYGLADAAWFYTENERAIWSRTLPRLKSVALSNTVSGVERILAVDLSHRRDALRAKYGITTTKNLIFCARFSGTHRRPDLLLKTMKTLDPKHFGLIIIGNGSAKPDFSVCPNVYDFGAVYDGTIKDELFAVADIYFQPGWLGLSAVEAMAYGKPVFTFKRSASVRHGVEYGYVESGVNGYIAHDEVDMVQKLMALSDDEIASLGANARNYAANNLTMNHMIDTAVGLLRQMFDRCKA